MKERDYYVIEERGGRKLIRYVGFFYATDAVADDFWRHLDVRHAGTPIEEAIDDVFTWVADTCSEDCRYIADLTEEEAEAWASEYFDGEPGECLGLESLTIDTPCGNYWSED